MLLQNKAMPSDLGMAVKDQHSFVIKGGSMLFKQSEKELKDACMCTLEMHVIFVFSHSLYLGLTLSCKECTER